MAGEERHNTTTWRRLLAFAAMVGACNSTTTTEKAPDAQALPGADALVRATGGTTAAGGASGPSASGGANSSGGSASGGNARGGNVGSGGSGAGGMQAGASDAASFADAGSDAVVASDAGRDSLVVPQPDLAADVGRDSGADLTVARTEAGRDGNAACPYTGHVTYTLAKTANPTTAEQTAYGLITTAMDKALTYYNCYTNITKAESVTYNASVATADGNSNGSIRFGGTAYMEYITAMHEISHTVGIGTASNWRSFVAIPDGGTSGPFTGTNATAQLRAITGVATDVLTADTQHFWPYGLNYTSEVKSEADVIDHCKMVVAIRKDLGLQL